MIKTMPDMLLNCFNYLYVNIYSSTIIYNLQIKCIVFMRGSDQRQCRLSSQRPSWQFFSPIGPKQYLYWWNCRSGLMPMDWWNIITVWRDFHKLEEPSPLGLAQEGFQPWVVFVSGVAWHSWGCWCGTITWSSSSPAIGVAKQSPDIRDGVKRLTLYSGNENFFHHPNHFCLLTTTLII